MKKRLQGFIAGVLCCVLFAGIGVLAKNTTETIQAIYRDIKIYVDGVKIEPKDANGNTVEPFIYNGTTYLPVRAVGNAFGKNVEWDDATNSVKLYSEAHTTASIKKDSTIGWVYDLLNDKGYTKNDGEYLYKIPQFNINTQDAEKANKIIVENLKPLIDEEFENITNGYSINMQQADYFVCENEKTVSVVTFTEYPNDCVHYESYTIDIVNGTVIDNQTLIEKAGYKKEEFSEKLKTLILNKFKELWGQYENGKLSAEYNYAYNYTVTELLEIPITDIPMYIGENGHLYVIPRVGSMAGAGDYEYIIDTGLIVY